MGKMAWQAFLSPSSRESMLRNLYLSSMLELCWVMLTFLWLLKFLLVCLVTSLGSFFKGGSLKWLRG